MRNKKLRKETSEGGRTKPLPSPGEGQLSRQAGGPTGKPDLPKGVQVPPEPGAPWWGQGRALRGQSREVGLLAGHLGPLGM